MVLRITLQSGETQEVPFELTSTITVTNETTADGLPVATTQAWTDIVGVELVEGQVEAAAAATTTEPEPVPPATSEATPVTPEHDVAVATAQADIEAITANAAAGQVDVTDHLAAAIADVDAALAVYPDSAELADAKQQLTELQADTSTTGS